MTKHGIALAGLAALSVAGLACSTRDSGVVKREGRPDFVTVLDSTKMDAAIAEAKSTLSRFDAALDANEVEPESFAVKKGFLCPDGNEEFIWINWVKRGADGVYQGVINNDPVDTKLVKLGQKVRVKRGEVVDWMYMDGGKLRGGYTIVALVHGTPDQEAYAKNLKIDWKDYKFLQGAD